MTMKYTTPAKGTSEQHHAPFPVLRVMRERRVTFWHATVIVAHAQIGGAA